MPTGCSRNFSPYVSSAKGLNLATITPQIGLPCTVAFSRVIAVGACAQYHTDCQDEDTRAVHGPNEKEVSYRPGANGARSEEVLVI